MYQKIKYLMKYFTFRDETKARMEVAKDSCIGRRYLSQLEDIRAHDIFNCLVTVRYIHKLTISCHCSGCQSIMTGGVCSYVGCRWTQGTQVNLKAWYVLCTIDFDWDFFFFLFFFFFSYFSYFSLIYFIFVVCIKCTQFTCNILNRKYF